MTFSGPISDYTILTIADVTTVVGDGEADSLMNVQDLVFAGSPVFYAGHLDPPSIDGTISGQRMTDEATMYPFSGITIADANSGQTKTVTVVPSNAADGKLSDETLELIAAATTSRPAPTRSAARRRLSARRCAAWCSRRQHQVAPGRQHGGHRLHSH